MCLVSVYISQRFHICYHCNFFSKGICLHLKSGILNIEDVLWRMQILKVLASDLLKIILKCSRWLFSLESSTNISSMWKKQKSLNWPSTFCINAVKHAGPYTSPKCILRNLYLPNMVVQGVLYFMYFIIVFYVLFPD